MYQTSCHRSKKTLICYKSLKNLFKIYHDIIIYYANNKLKSCFFAQTLDVCEKPEINQILFISAPLSVFPTN